MSTDPADIRNHILRSVRRSTATYDSELNNQANLEHQEYRNKFLECRKKFEEPMPPAPKEPFFAEWINPKMPTEVSITYRRQGSRITDVRINTTKPEEELAQPLQSSKLLVEESVEDKPRDAVTSEQVHRYPIRSIAVIDVESYITATTTYSIDEYFLSVFPDGHRNPEGEKGLVAKIEQERSFPAAAPNELPTRLDSRGRDNEESVSQQTFSKPMLHSSNEELHLVTNSVSHIKQIQQCSKNKSVENKKKVVQPIVKKFIKLKKYDHILYLAQS